MKIKKNILIFFIFFVNCTGVNIGYLVRYNGTAHPLPEYTSPFGTGYDRGGIILYRDSLPGQVNGMNTLATKKSQSCSKSYLYLYSTGDSSIQSAASKENINKIAQVNYTITAYLGGFLYHEFCTILSGE